MKLPRVSILTLMVIVVIVALNGVAIRSIGSRLQLLSGEALFAAFLVFPMANVLALFAATRTRWGRRDRAFFLGFEVVGWSVVAATILGIKPILKGLEAGAVALGLVGWISASPVREAIVGYVVLPAFFLLMQLIAAMVGGRIARAIWARGPEAEVIDPPSARAKLAPGAWLVLILAIPVIAIEIYFQLKVDPGFERLEPGSVAVVILQQNPMFPSPPMAGPPFGVPIGSQVRIDSDRATNMMEITIAGNGVEHRRDHRTVQVTVLDGERKGESVLLPYYFLRPVP